MIRPFSRSTKCRFIKYKFGPGAIFTPPPLVPKEMLLLLISNRLPDFSQKLLVQVTYTNYKAIFLPSSDISTALLLAKASLFLSAAARMCLSSFVASFFLILERSASVCHSGLLT